MKSVIILTFLELRNQLLFNGLNTFDCKQKLPKYVIAEA